MASNKRFKQNLSTFVWATFDCNFTIFLKLSIHNNDSIHRITKLDMMSMMMTNN